MIADVRIVRDSLRVDNNVAEYFLDDFYNIPAIRMKAVCRNIRTMPLWMSLLFQN